MLPDDGLGGIALEGHSNLYDPGSLLWECDVVLRNTQTLTLAMEMINPDFKHEGLGFLPR